MGYLNYWRDLPRYLELTGEIQILHFAPALVLLGLLRFGLDLVGLRFNFDHFDSDL